MKNFRNNFGNFGWLLVRQRWFVGIQDDLTEVTVLPLRHTNLHFARQPDLATDCKLRFSQLLQSATSTKRTQIASCSVNDVQ